MAWTTDAEIESALASVLGLASANDVPSHWDEMVTAGNTMGYHHVRGVLAARGYTPAQMDVWDARVQWNRIAALYFTLEAANLDDDRALQQLSRLWERLKELGTITLTEDGVVIEPATTSANISYGDYVTTTDEHTMDDTL